MVCFSTNGERASLVRLYKTTIVLYDVFYLKMLLFHGDKNGFYYILSTGYRWLLTTNKLHLAGITTLAPCCILYNMGLENIFSSFLSRNNHHLILIFIYYLFNCFVLQFYYCCYYYWRYIYIIHLIQENITSLLA